MGWLWTPLSVPWSLCGSYQNLLCAVPMYTSAHMRGRIFYVEIDVLQLRAMFWDGNDDRYLPLYNYDVEELLCRAASQSVPGLWCSGVPYRRSTVVDLMMTTSLVETCCLFDTFMVIKEYCCVDVLPFIYFVALRDASSKVCSVSIYIRMG